MKNILTNCLVAALASFLANQPVLAGQIYGTIEEANRPAKNKLVRVVCPGNKSGQRNTDDHGSYSVYVDGSGKCRVWVNEVGPLVLRVYDEEARYDLKISNGTLHRK